MIKLWLIGGVIGFIIGFVLSISAVVRNQFTDLTLAGIMMLYSIDMIAKENAQLKN